MAFDSETWRSESGLHYLSIALRNKIINIDRARDGTPDRERAMWDKRIEACFSGVVLCEQAALESWIAAALRTHDISIRKAKGEVALDYSVAPGVACTGCQAPAPSS